ncbi:MAG: PQQ-binding-like beta-propeller repeat protein [Planctomycetota bacterium]|nr:PQQ-binding-like beta-propeller repeat protein [Planctomycetota bacterium]
MNCTRRSDTICCEALTGASPAVLSRRPLRDPASVRRQIQDEHTGVHRACMFWQFMAILLIVPGITAQTSAEDWPQWRGPQRDAVSAETGLLQSWPEGGPGVAWKAAELGTGYSSVVVGRGRMYTMGLKGSDVVVTALDVETGTSVWTRKIGETERHPSSTPTLDGDRLYALDPDGDLVCLKVETGEVVWQASFADDFGGRMMSGRGYGESPLVDGDRLICTPGGPDAALVALDKMTGKLVWKATLPELGPQGKDGAGFSSVVVTEAAGLRQYVQLVGRGVVGIDASDGRYLWGYNAIANGTANIPTPIVHDEYVFAANGYTAGSVLLKLVAENDPNATAPGVKAEVVYTLSGSQFQNHHGGVVRLGDYLFGGHGNNNGLPTCLDFRTGRVTWKRRGPGVGSAAIICADGQLYYRYQNGVVALIEATDRGYQLNGTLEIPGAGGDSWAHPVIANSRLYLREQDTVWVYDLSRDSASAKSIAMPHAANSSAAVLAIRELGVSVEPLSVSESNRRIYRFAALSVDETQTAETFLVTLSDAQVSPEGTLSEELIGLLKDIREPVVVSPAGTRLSDAGLLQLKHLHLVGLNLELCSRVTDAGLEHVQHIAPLRVLVLTGTSVTHVGLQHLVSNNSILALDLELCDGVTDEACVPLSEMKQLLSLVLKKTGFERGRISDAGLERLQSLTDLEVLNLYGNNVTDVGLGHLQPLRNLRELNLSLLAISDAGLTHLKPLSGLEHLELLYSEGFSGPMLTDGVADALTPLLNLTSLNLTGAKLTDAGLERLRVLTRLKSLQLVRTGVSEDGLREFQKAVPECEVIKE